MRPIIPSGDFPPNVDAVKFSAPEGLEDQVNDIVGLIHKHPETGDTVAIEFLFELTKEEQATLRHEPYLTLTIATETLSPFSLQTTYEYDEKYSSLMEHQHVCTVNLTHEKQKWWRCDNPRHDSKEFRIRECDECFEKRTSDYEEVTEDESGTSDAPEDPIE